MALRAGGIQYDLVTGLRVTAGGGKHLGLASKDKAKTRPILTNSPRDQDAAPAPIVAFDITSGAYRLAAHVLRALFA